MILSGTHALTKAEREYIDIAACNIYLRGRGEDVRTLDEVRASCDYMVLEVAFARANGYTWIGDMPGDAWKKYAWDVADVDGQLMYDTKKQDDRGFWTVKPRILEHLYDNRASVDYVALGLIDQLSPLMWRWKVSRFLPVKDMFVDVPWKPNPSLPRHAGLLNTRYWKKSSADEGKITWYYDHNVEKEEVA